MSDDAPSPEQPPDAALPPPKPKKCSPAHKALMARRMNDMVAWRLKGATFRKVRQSVAALEQQADSAWFVGPDGKSLSARSLWRYISHADKEITVRSKSTRERLTYRQLARREDLYNECRTKGDSATALNVLKDMDQLRGLYPPQKVAPTNPEGDAEYGQLGSLGALAVALQGALERRASGPGLPPPGGDPQSATPIMDALAGSADGSVPE